MKLGCGITFWPGNPVQPSLELLTTMCIIRNAPSRRPPQPANDNPQAASA
jgi:hypothetical protein